MEDKKSIANELIIRYGTAVIATILSMGLGAFTLTSAIARLADAGVSAPSLLSIFGNGSIISIVTGGCLSVFLAVVAKLSLGKIVASKDAGILVNSRSYHLISQAGQSFCLVFAGLATVAACGILLASLLSVNEHTPWVSNLLGGIIPMSGIAGGLFGAKVMIGKFVKAELKPSQLSIIVLSVAIAGLSLASIAVLVKTHTPSTSTESLMQHYYDVNTLSR